MSGQGDVWNERMILPFYHRQCSWRLRTAEPMPIRWQTWSCSPLMLWLCPSLKGSRTGHGSCTWVYSASHPGLGCTSSRPRCRWPLPVSTPRTPSEHTECSRVAEHQRPDEEVPYHSGYRFKIEAREFDDVSKFKYGTERRGLWMVKASADIAGINPLHQITPRNTVDLYNTPTSVTTLYLASEGEIVQLEFQWFFSPCDAKQREGDRVFDEERVVLRGHQERRARWRSEHKRAKFNPVRADRPEQLRAECRFRSSVLVHTRGCGGRSRRGTRPAPRTSWCYSHTRPSFLLHTGNMH